MLYFLLFLVIPALHPIPLFELKSQYIEAGCRRNGIIFPSPTNADSWNHFENRTQFINFLANSKHPLAQKLCLGNEKQGTSKTHTFHLSWECYDRNVNCILPTVNTKTLKTLIYHHPNSQINIWSLTLLPDLVQQQIGGLKNVKFRRYNETLFHDLPHAASDASWKIRQYFTNNPYSHSHWSDLLRITVLYKYGGIWTDFDSLFVAPIDSIKSEEWLAKTESNVEFSIKENGKASFIIEGGMLKFKKGSQFLEKVLENFPEYTDEISNCWACVGPKLLTEMYEKYQPKNVTLINSQIIFGNRRYRSSLDFVHEDLDLELFEENLKFNIVAFHLFTSSYERSYKDESVIDILFRSQDVYPTSKFFMIPLGELSQRRSLSNSIDYDIDNYILFQLYGTGMEKTSFSSEEAAFSFILSDVLSVPLDVILLEFPTRSDGAQNSVFIDVALKTTNPDAVNIINDVNFLSKLNEKLVNEDALKNLVMLQSTHAQIEVGKSQDEYENIDHPQVNIITTTESATGSGSDDDQPKKDEEEEIFEQFNDFQYYIFAGVAILAVCSCCLLYYFCCRDSEGSVISRGVELAHDSFGKRMPYTTMHDKYDERSEEIRFVI